MTEAITLMDSIEKAQRRKYMQTNRYATSFAGLDVSLKGPHTKGDPQTGRGGNGFVMVLMGDHTSGAVYAFRELNGNFMNSSLQYQYNLIRDYWSDNVTCQGNNAAGEELCADFCGIDTPVGACCNDGTSHSCPRPTNN